MLLHDVSHIIHAAVADFDFVFINHSVEPAVRGRAK